MFTGGGGVLLTGPGSCLFTGRFLLTGFFLLTGLLPDEDTGRIGVGLGPGLGFFPADGAAVRLAVVGQGLDQVVWTL